MVVHERFWHWQACSQVITIIHNHHHYHDDFKPSIHPRIIKTVFHGQKICTFPPYDAVMRLIKSIVPRILVSREEDSQVTSSFTKKKHSDPFSRQWMGCIVTKATLWSFIFVDGWKLRWLWYNFKKTLPNFQIIQAIYNMPVPPGVYKTTWKVIAMIWVQNANFDGRGDLTLGATLGTSGQMDLFPKDHAQLKPSAWQTCCCSLVLSFYFQPAWVHM